MNNKNNNTWTPDQEKVINKLSNDFIDFKNEVNQKFETIATDMKEMNSNINRILEHLNIR